MSLLHTSVVNFIQSLSPNNIVLSTLNETTNVFSPSISSKDLSSEVLSIIKSVEKEVLSGICGVSDSLTNGFTPHFIPEKEAVENIREFVNTNLST